MKKYVLLIAFLLTAAACSQQQEPKGKMPAPGGMPARSPQEIQQLEQFAAGNPKNAQAWIVLGDAFMDSNRFSEAIEAYRKGIALDPKNTNAIVDMGTCFRNLGQPKLAVEQYRKALKIDPNHLNANHNLGVVLANDLKEKKAALQPLEKYLQLAPMAPDAPEIREMVSRLKSGK